MYQHSTLCFRKHSRHRFLVTTPSIHENNFVLTSVWKGGRRGGEGRPEIDAGQSRRLLFTYFPDPDARKSKTRGGSGASGAALRPLTPSSPGRQPLRAEPHRQKCAQTGRKQRPPSLHLTLEQRQHSIPGESMWSSSPAVTGFLWSERSVTGYSG